MRRVSLLLAAVVALVSASTAQPLLPYKNANLPIAQRVEDLLSRMTVEEKFWQCFMIPGEVKPGEEAKYQRGIFGLQVSASSQQAGAAAQLLQYNASEDAVALAGKINRLQRFFVERTRLGIPIIAFDEALHGLVRGGATAFPQAIGLAATFDTALMAQVAGAIAAETRARGIRQILSPVINLANDVRWGRTEETYGEDPWLSASMGVAYMGALERSGIVATPKHFVANVGEGGRDSYPIGWSEWYLRQSHLLPFEWALKKAGSRSIMTAYNTVNGQAATAHPWLLQRWLKQEQGFGGFVISDAGATGGTNVLHMTATDYAESGAQAINAGLDVIFQTDYDHYQLFIAPFLDGRISPQRLDDAVRRVLRAKFELGLFEQPYVSVDAVRQLPMATHRQLARTAAAKSLVLLKNEGLLPLRLPAGGRLAVLGEDAVLGRLGGYSGPGNGTVSILEGLRRQYPAVRYAQGYSRSHRALVPVPPSVLFHPSASGRQPGLQARYFDNMELSGAPRLQRTDANIQFKWTLYAPDTSLRRDFFAAEWTGLLVPDTSGVFELGLEGNDGFRLYLNDSLLIDQWAKLSYRTSTVPCRLIKGQAYRLKVQFKEPVGEAHLQLVWSRGVDTALPRQLRQQAVATAKQADAVVFVAGIHEGEFQDRALLGLDAGQQELIAAVAATGKPLVVVLVGGSAITMPWLPQASAVLMAWYPGEAGGEAVADVLLGKQNPAGRLPISFPVHESQLPLSYWHLPTGRGNDYHNLSGEPLFPFGHGLSYTQFQYSQLALSAPAIGPADTVIVSCTVTNTGPADGEEVVQLYIRDELASIARPLLELKGARRLALKKGESKQVQFRVGPEELQLWNADLQRVVEPGDFRIMIGASAKDLRLKTTLRVLPAGGGR